MIDSLDCQSGKASFCSSLAPLAAAVTCSCRRHLVAGVTWLLSKVAGDAQIGTVGEQLPKPLVVQVLTQREEPAVNRQVEFSLVSDAAAGEVSPEVAVTDDHGNAERDLEARDGPGVSIQWSREWLDAKAKPSRPNSVPGESRGPGYHQCCQPAQPTWSTPKEVNTHQRFGSWIVSEIRLKACRCLAGDRGTRRGQGSNHSDGSRWDYLSQVDPWKQDRRTEAYGHDGSGYRLPSDLHGYGSVLTMNVRSRVPWCRDNNLIFVGGKRL